MMMRVFLRPLALAAALIAAAIPARADQFTAKNAAATTITLCSRTNGAYDIPCHVMVDVLGNPVGTLTNPLAHNLSQVGGVAFTLGPKSKSAGLPIALPTDPDTLAASGTITAADAASTTAAGQNGTSIVTGTPTTGSTYAVALNGQAETVLTVTGSFVQTLQFEGSANNGATWTPRTAHVLGTGYTATAITLPGQFHLNSAGLTNLRLRATAFTSGTATAQANTTGAPGSFYVMNPIKLIDNTSGNQAVIKPGNTAVASDNALVMVDPYLAGFLGPKLDQLHTDAVPTTAPGTAGSTGITATIVPVTVAPTDRGGTITTGGTSQQVAAANTSRRAISCQNPAAATEDLFFAVGAGAATVTGAGDFADVAPGGSVTFAFGNTTVQAAIQAIAATTGHRFLCTELQ